MQAEHRQLLQLWLLRQHWQLWLHNVGQAEQQPCLGLLNGCRLKSRAGAGMLSPTWQPC